MSSTTPYPDETGKVPPGPIAEEVQKKEGEPGSTPTAESGLDAEKEVKSEQTDQLTPSIPEKEAPMAVQEDSSLSQDSATDLHSLSEEKTDKRSALWGVQGEHGPQFEVVPVTEEWKKDDGSGIEETIPALPPSSEQKGEAGRGDSSGGDHQAETPPSHPSPDPALEEGNGPCGVYQEVEGSPGEGKDVKTVSKAVTESQVQVEDHHEEEAPPGGVPEIKIVDLSSPDSGVESIQKSASTEEEQDNSDPQTLVKGKAIIVSGVSGSVRWFNVKHAYGFIHRDDNGVDVFVHQTSIKRKNPKRATPTLGDGEKVEFDIIEGTKGMEAVNVTGPKGAAVIGSTFVPLRRPFWKYGRQPHPDYIHDYDYDSYGSPPSRRRSRDFDNQGGDFSEAATMDFQPFEMIGGGGRGMGGRRRKLPYEERDGERAGGRSYRRNRRKQTDTETESESKDVKGETEHEAGCEDKSEIDREHKQTEGHRKPRKGKKERKEGREGSESQDNSKTPQAGEKRKKKSKKGHPLMKEEGTQTEVEVEQ